MTTSAGAKAKQLLQRRESPWTVFDYLRRSLVLKLAISVVIAFLAAWLYQRGGVLAAGLIAGFWMGQVVRDLRWYAALSREWASTADFIDWQRVEEVSAQESEGAA